MTHEEKQLFDKLIRVYDATGYVWATMVKTIGGAHTASLELSKALWAITNAQDTLETGLPITDCIEIETIWHTSHPNKMESLCGIDHEPLFPVHLQRVTDCPQCREILKETLEDNTSD